MEENLRIELRTDEEKDLIQDMKIESAKAGCKWFKHYLFHILKNRNQIKTDLMGKAGPTWDKKRN